MSECVRILLDPPCSGLGQRPRIKESMSLAKLKGYSPYQRKLFHTAVQLLKVNGILVYSTYPFSQHIEMHHISQNSIFSADFILVGNVT
jgi:hypothetical protein